jgi:hypothetical protein
MALSRLAEFAGGIRAAYFTEYSVARKRAEPPMTLTSAS